jgi:hypothetical protein
MAVLKNLVMRGASQRLGGMVLYQLKGQTLARELAPAVTNPRTPAQMDNRVRLQNVVSVYRANRAWMRGAFENKKEKESDYNAFVSANLSSSQVAFTKQQAAAGAAVAAPYQITSGSLGSIEQSVHESELQTNIYLGNLVLSPATTVGEFAAAVIANNNGIVQGMQLSLILNIQQVNQVTGIPYIITRAYEVLLDAQEQELLSAYYPGALLSNGGGSDNILYADLSDNGSGTASFILSQTTSAITRVSEQSLLQYGDLGIYSQYTSPAAVAAAVASYGENEINFLDSDSAGEQNSVPLTNGIAYMLYSFVRYADGDYVGTDISKSNNMAFNMLLPLDTNTLTNASVYDVTDDVTLTLTTQEITSDRRSVLLKLANNITPVSRHQIRAAFVVSGQTYTFNFVVGPEE